MRILVTGAAGLLGMEVVRAVQARGHDTLAMDHAQLDVTDSQKVAKTVGRHWPDAIVHCAAYTAVDRAEAEPELAMTVNRDGTRNVARAASEHGATVVYVSTDYVFDGKSRRPYRPDDEPQPLSAYGRSKLEGERAIQEVGAPHLIARTSWLYGRASGFVPSILRRAAKGEPLRVVNDQRGRPTWVLHAARDLLALLEGGARGVWHVAGGGECTWHELASEAVRLAGLQVDIEAIPTAELGAAARRPAYSVLDLEATERLLGRGCAPWKDALEQYIRHDWNAMGRRTA